MRDKLIELIKSRRDPCDIGACPFVVDDVRPCSLCEAESLAEHLIANGVTVGDVPETNVGKWIPIKERLPEHSGLVLVYGIGEPEIMNFDYLDKTWHGTRCRRITHWMPLPEPPKEG